MYQDGRTYHHGERFSITCADSRSPEILAKEISRRLLPEYVEEYAKAKAWVTGHEADEDEAKLVAKRIAQAIGGRVGEGRWNRGDGTPVLADIEGIQRVTVQPALSFTHRERPVRVDMQLTDVPPEVAVEILKLLQEAEVSRPTHARVSHSTSQTAELAEDEDSEIPSQAEMVRIQ